MTFLAPFALLGVLLLAIPIVVHLFKPRKMRQTPFSSLRWLKQTHQRLSRRIQWHQWLLFLLRAGCILLLVLALGRPLLGTWGGTGATDRFVIVDTSRSMGFQLTDRPTSLAQAVDLAERILQSSQPGDRTGLVLAGNPPRLITPPVVDASEYLPTLKATRPGLADATVSATLPLVRSLLSRQGDGEVEIVFLTDNLNQRWQQKEVQTVLKNLPKPPRIKVIDVGPGSAHNAWIADARLLSFGPDEDRWLYVDVGCVGESPSPRSVRLTGVASFADETQAVTLKAGQLSRIEFKLPAGLPLQSQVAELRLEPTDALPSDDVFWLNLDTSLSLKVLLIEPESSGPDGRPVGLFLRAGMAALASAKNQLRVVTSRNPATATAGDVQKADVILLAGVPELSDTIMESLEKRVRAGAGLAVFLGPQVMPAFWNQKFYRIDNPAEGLSPWLLKTGSDGFIFTNRAGLLTNLRWTHPLLTPLHDPIQGDLTQSRFRTYGSLDGSPNKNDAVLARFDDDTPAIVERPIGKGRVLLFNTTANDEWSDLPRHKSFVPLVDRMLSVLSAGGRQRNFTVGDVVSVPLPTDPAGSEVTVVTPGGARRQPRLIGVGGQSVLHLDEIGEAGIYRVEGTGFAKFAFVVNTGRADSSLTAMDVGVLESWWAPAAFEVQSAEVAGQQLQQQSHHWPLGPALVAIAGLLLVAETLYVYWHCPRSNPKVADAVVPQRGMMRPAGETMP